MPSSQQNLQASKELMDRFAARTGLLSSDTPSKRYLWTDSFAVCNFLGLAETTKEEREKYEGLAKTLVNSVHENLGRFRTDDDASRRGMWLSGLSEDEGSRHPTAGGLRIGKTLPERALNEPYDHNAEWDRDGQYFHYLTKWMFALDQMERYSTGDVSSHYGDWAKELARKAADKFVYGHRMYWKMSVDLSRPQVPSMGAQDPVDGYVTLTRLLETSSADSDLVDEIKVKQKLFKSISHISATDDPLGIGGMLVDAFRLNQLEEEGRVAIDQKIKNSLIEESLVGLGSFVQGRELRSPAEYRLAFRELGLSIGLHSIENMDKRFKKYLGLAGKIESFWLDPKNQRSRRWKEHQDINEVMLATSLAPDGFLKGQGKH